MAWQLEITSHSGEKAGISKSQSIGRRQVEITSHRTKEPFLPREPHHTLHFLILMLKMRIAVANFGYF